MYNATNFDDYIHKRYYNRDTEYTRHRKKVPCVSLRSSPPSVPGDHWSAFCHYQIVSFLLECHIWKNTARIPLYVASFTQHNVLFPFINNYTLIIGLTLYSCLSRISILLSYYLLLRFSSTLPSVSSNQNGSRFSFKVLPPHVCRLGSLLRLETIKVGNSLDYWPARQPPNLSAFCPLQCLQVADH